VLNLDETTLKVLESVEQLPVVVTQQTSDKLNSNVFSSHRRDFTITPRAAPPTPIKKAITSPSSSSSSNAEAHSTS
jgi:hypothetical protein